MLKKICGLSVAVFAAASMAFAASEVPLCGNAPANPLVDAMDCKIDPCVDFYQYACGTWRKKNPLPSDRARTGRFDQLQDRNDDILKAILEKAAVDAKGRMATDQKIGDQYASCMDQAKVNELGLAPIKSELDRIEQLKSKAELGSLIAVFHDKDIGVFFNFGSGQDMKNASKVIAQFDQGGTRLPSKDYYFDTDAKSQEIREKYLKHIEKMFVLLGDSEAKASANAKVVMEIETALAKNALRPVERRDPIKTYHMKKVPELQKLVPFMDWKKYMKAIGTPTVSSLNVGVVEFAQGLEETIQKSKLDDLKSYLKWIVVSSSAPLLSEMVENENFDFFGRTLSGQKEMRPRWYRCTKLVDRQLGEALGKAYVEKAFGGDSKKRMMVLVGNIEKALAKNISTDLPWMTKATKKQALLKLKAIAKKIGYPEKWRDYSKLQIVRGELIANAQRANTFETRRQLAKIGKPVDKNEWYMTPPTANAYYDPQNNNINFPAGILQPPFFDRSIDDPVNYGAIGMVIGHEITHGFDDQGRQFDPKGNLRDWWTPADSKAFDERAKCVVDQSSAFVAVKDEKNGDIKQDGKLTLGEDAADNGGIRISWNALMNYANGKKLPAVDGLTAAQRFFMGFAGVWCSNQSDESATKRAKTDPHSAAQFRVNGTVSNMPEFQEAFSCKTGQPMAPEKRCRIW